MKTLFVKTLLLAGALAPASYALSLYDTAPPIGLPESHAVKYSASVSVGYDDNLNSSSVDEEDGLYAQGRVSASYADVESVDRITYNASIGGRLYDKDARGTGRDQFLDCNLSAALSHTITAKSVYSMTLSASASVDPDISNGISAALNQGECISWTWSHAYSQGIDARWSWSANCSYSGNLYTDSDYNNDDRQYLSGGLTLTNRYSTLTSYNFSTSYRYDFRQEGDNSNNVFMNVGMSHSLSPISSMSASAGLQYKHIADLGKLYPTLNAAYNRQLSDGLSARVFISYSNENVNNYRYAGTYRSTQTLRVGTDFSYAFTHKVSFNYGVSLLNSRYSKHGGGASSRSETTWYAHVGMSYKFTNQLTGSINYKYTDASREAGDYDRNTISSSLSYSF